MIESFDRQNTLQHERLDPYAVAVKLDVAVVAAAHKSGPGHAWIADQAMRASASAMFNFAEALGREGADRARALRIARGSALGGSMSKSQRRLGATHCVAIHGVDAALTLMRHRSACRDMERNADKDLTVRVVARRASAEGHAGGSRRGPPWDVVHLPKVPVRPSKVDSG